MNKECKLAFAYLHEKRAAACLLAAAVAFLFLITELYHAPRELAVYTSLMLSTGAALAFAAGLYRYRAVHNALQVLLRQSGTALEELPAPRGLLDEDWQALVRAVDAARRSAVERSEAARRDAQEYYTLWAHQIKVPLAAMRMLLQSEPGPASDRLTAELFKVEQYVEMLLGYQRLTGPSTDFTLRQCDVNAVMRASARRFAPLFIEKKLRLNYQETTLRALTDEKWLAFVLEQVLSNAVKYTRRGSVTLRADEAAHAVIVEDTGIGIAPEDLPRVFDHGYTGLNGRKDKRATGLGLYLSRRILDQLGHTISIASEPGRGTRVTIGLDSLRMRAE